MHERAQTTWAELQAERGVPTRSVVNDTPRPVAVHDTATGDLETVDQPGVAEDLPFVTTLNRELTFRSAVLGCQATDSLCHQ